MSKKRRIVLIIHNVRSCHNVGSLLRTAEGLGIEHVYLSGHTPYPRLNDDTRLPHEYQRVEKQIHKTALGAEKMIAWSVVQDPKIKLRQLQSNGFTILGLEQTSKAQILAEFKPPPAVALLVGNEVRGIDKQLLAHTNKHLKIPMAGQKESFNVAIAAAIALYHLRFLST